MNDHELSDGVVVLRDWADDDAAWYADSVRDPLIQRFTTDSPTLDAAQVRAAIDRLRGAGDAEGFIICDALTGERLGNIALDHDSGSGQVSYWVAAGARGRGVAARALAMFSSWSFRAGLSELWLRVHRDNAASHRTAVQAGYQRDPARDKTQEVKGATWPMLGYVLRRPDP
ncbi:MAG TPA: GNAT family protein [Streptosporangiaceae bacterium]|jgi:RimJ/RimL family protein N-acetyltransferase